MAGQEETHGLLEEFASGETFDLKALSGSETAIAPGNDTGADDDGKISRIRLPWGMVLPLFIMALLAWMFTGILHGEHGPELKATFADQLAIELHPSQHATRPATTIVLNWTISVGTRAPDGVQKRVYLVNDEFPGPTIEARSGDRIIVHVHNALADEGVSIHWHGLRLTGSNAMDGAVGFTQCPIPAGGDFVYDFGIGDDEHGTFWWHSHMTTQRTDGLYGGFVVHAPGPDLAETNADALVMIGDWFHREHAEVLAWYQDYGSMGNEPVPDSLLVNGKGRYNCSMAVPARPVVCDQIRLSSMTPLFRSARTRTRLRVINTGSIAGFTMKMDGATMQVMQVDGGYGVQAEAREAVGVLYPGERMDVVVAWKKGGSALPWLKVYLDDENFAFTNPALNPDQIFPLLPATIDVAATTTGERAPLLEEGTALDLATLTSTTRVSEVLPPLAQETILLYIKTQMLSRFSYRPMGFINHTSWEPQSPPLLAQNRSSWDSNQLLPFIPIRSSERVRVDLVLNNLDDGSHPFHLHGNSFYILSSYRNEGRAGWGSYNPYTGQKPPAGLNLENPMRKDTVSVPRRGHVVLSFMADNPGLWMLHCHMAVHMASGMAVGLQVGDVDDIDHVTAMDETAARLCHTD